MNDWTMAELVEALWIRDVDYARSMAEAREDEIARQEAKRER